MNGNFFEMCQLIYFFLFQEMSCQHWIKQEPKEENETKFDPSLNQNPSQDFDQSQVKEESERDTLLIHEMGISNKNSMFEDNQVRIKYNLNIYF